MSLSTVGGTLTAVGGTLSGLTVGEPEPFPTLADFAYARGVNTAGGEFDHTASGLPGTYGGNHSYSPLSYLQALRGRGHRIIRLPFRWERIQPTLSGPLDATGLGHLQDAVEAARQAGLMVLLDMHNYCRYYRADDVEVMFEQGITEADWTDVWTKLTQAFADQPAVAAWGLMNEPYALPTYGPHHTQTEVFHTFAAGTEGWSASGSGHTITLGSYPYSTGVDGAAEVSKVMPSSGTSYTSIIRMNASTSGALRNGVWPDGYWLRFEVFIPTSTPGDWRCRPEVVDNAFATTTGEYQRVPKGVVTHIYQQVPTALSGTNHRHAGLQFESRQNDGVTPSVIKVGQVDIGTVSGSSSTWKNYSQAAVDAIRTAGDNRPVFIAGDQFGGAERWQDKNGAPWITDPADNTYYEAHYYCSQAYNASGFTTYAAAEADAVARGWADLATRVTDELGDFTDWCSSNSVRGFIGEIGWPHDADAAQWNTIGELMYDLLDAAGMGATQWTAGTAWSLGQPLNVYEGDPPTVQAQATVIEAHPSLPAA